MAKSHGGQNCNKISMIAEFPTTPNAAHQRVLNSMSRDQLQIRYVEAVILSAEVHCMVYSVQTNRE